MTEHRRRWLLLYNWVAGLCDTSTGVLLVLAPVWTYRLMGLTVLPQPVAFARFNGVFVLCVGLSYLCAAVAWPLPGSVGQWRAQWWITALMRAAVAILLAMQIAAGAMEHGWIAVVATDLLFAIIQAVGLTRRWLALAD